MRRANEEVPNLQGQFQDQMVMFSPMRIGRIGGSSGRGHLGGFGWDEHKGRQLKMF